jgi:asparagine synthase (glutamine-hydrolysing)
VSGFAGIWHRDGRPADRGTVATMIQRLAHRGADGGSVWHSGPLAFAETRGRIYPERRLLPSPHVDPTSGSVVVLDGRIDNREEVAGALAAAGHPASSLADAEIVLRACEAWGSGALVRLLGEFAFASYDARTRTLLCARDVRAIRPLCYRIDGDTIAFASELHALVRPPFDQPGPNEGFIAEHLVSILNSMHETLFEGVYRVPPASVLVVTPDSARVVEYWQIDPNRTIRYADDREYDDHYRSLVFSAVDCRLRDVPRAGILLSGGLDSSVVAGTASSLARDRGGVPQLQAFSLSFPGLECDERHYIDDVTTRWAMPATIIEHPVCDPFEDDVRRYRDLPSYANGASGAPLFEAARAQGFTLMLTGLGGDEWTAGHPAHYADMLGRGEWTRLLREIAADRRSGVFYGWRRSAWNTIRPMLPASVLSAARSLVRHTPIPRWIRPEFAERVNLVDRLYAVQTRFGFPTYVQNEIYRQAITGFCPHAYEMFDRTTARAGIEASHPLDDRRLIEFGMALPETQRWANGMTKVIVRRAAADLLPPRVRTRGESAGYSTVFVDAMRRLHARDRLAAPSPVFDAWVDRGALLEEFDRVFGKPLVNDWPIWMALAVRIWSDQLLENRDGEESTGSEPRAGIGHRWRPDEAAVCEAGAH